jgi:hypothetical protein
VSISLTDSIVCFQSQRWIQIKGVEIFHDEFSAAEKSLSRSSLVTIFSGCF